MVRAVWRRFGFHMVLEVDGLDDRLQGTQHGIIVVSPSFSMLLWLPKRKLEVPRTLHEALNRQFLSRQQIQGDGQGSEDDLGSGRAQRFLQFNVLDVGPLVTLV